MLDHAFVDLQKIDPRIVLDIRYATENNFVGKVVYTMPKCFLRKAVALKLKTVQDALEKLDLGLKVFDGYRPLTAQKFFWELMPDERYVANPAVGSRHHRGASVDVTLVNRHGELPMPTEFDAFNEKSHRSCMEASEEAICNRAVLEAAMRSQGFIGLPTEWWHFDDVDWMSYPIEDFSLEELCNLNPI